MAKQQSRWQRAWNALRNEPEPSIAGSRLREAVDDDDDLYRSVGSTGATTQYRELHLGILRRAQDASVALHRSNPLAKRIIGIYTSYMAGEGFTITGHNPDLQAELDRFWKSPRNRLDRNHKDLARNHLLLGETIAPVAADSMGNVTQGWIDPKIIHSIEPDPRNNLILAHINLETDHATASMTTVDTQSRLEVVRASEMPGTEMGLYVGDAHFFILDRVAVSTRGIPFLLPALDWLDAYDQVLWETLQKIQAQRAFFWDVEVDGGQDQVDEAEQIWGTAPPTSGSVRFRTSAFRVKAETANLNDTYPTVAAGRHILRHIATAAGVPPHWLGDPEDANRSTAESMDKPTLNALVDVQADWELAMHDVATYAAHQKVIAGMLPAQMERYDEFGNPTGAIEPVANLIEVATPAITDDNLAQAAQAVAQTAQALISLEMAGASGPDLARKVLRRVLPALGVPADDIPDSDDDPEPDMGGTDDDVVAALEAYARGSF